MSEEEPELEFDSEEEQYWCYYCDCEVAENDEYDEKHLCDHCLGYYKDKLRSRGILKDEDDD
jgi:hypothetical protein